MKLGIFTDSHYSSHTITGLNKRRHNSQSLKKIKEAYDFFAAENCDLVICLGDLIDKEDSHQKEIDNLKEIAKVISHSSIKTVCLMGNHDAFAFSKEEFYNILGIDEPTNLHFNNRSLIFIDACYFENGRHYLPGDTDWTDTFYPYIKNLENELLKTQNAAYIFIHQNLDTNIPYVHCLRNSATINDLIFKSNTVKAVIQGHFHEGAKSIHNGIEYITFPAMCENENAYFIKEI